MYFVKINNLKADIAENGVPPRDSLIYIILLMLLITIPSGNMQIEVFNPIYWVINSVILIIGTIYCYMKNGGDSGKNFLSRHFSITFVVSIRFFIVLCVLSFIFFFLISLRFESLINFESKGFSYSFKTIFYSTILIYYYRIGKHIKDVAQLTENRNWG